MSKLLVAVGLALAATSCATPLIPTPLKVEDGVNYMRQGTFDVNGVKGYPAMAVVPQAAKYIVWYHGPGGDQDFILLRTRGGERAGSRGDKDFKFEYVPTPGISAPLPGDPRIFWAPISIVGVEKGSLNRHSFAWLGFKDPAHYTLPATLKCNDTTVKDSGVMACQSAAGLETAFVFEAEVMYQLPKDNPCIAFRTTDSRTFEFTHPSGTCTVTFQETKAPKRRALVTVYGYDKILPGGG